jgi:plastocyanin
MAGYNIQISVDEKGNFTFQPTTLRVRGGDTVTWSSNDGEFSIMFVDGTPFEGTQDGSEVDAMDTFGGNGSRSTPLTIKRGAQGHFHYAASVNTPRRVYLDAGCPEIVVN